MTWCEKGLPQFDRPEGEKAAEVVVHGLFKFCLQPRYRSEVRTDACPRNWIRSMAQSAEAFRPLANDPDGVGLAIKIVNVLSNRSG